MRLAATTTLKQPLSLCVLAVNAQGRAMPGYPIHARAPVSPCGSVRRLPEGEGFLFSPGLFPSGLAKLWLFLYLTPVEATDVARPRTLAALRPSRLEIWKSPPPAGIEIGHHSFDSTNYQNHQTVQLLEIYQNHQRDGWRMYFTGTGHRQPIEQISRSCGIDITEGDLLPMPPAGAAPDILPKALLQRPAGSASAPAGSASAPAGSASAPAGSVSAPPPLPPPPPAPPQAILPPQAIPRPPALPPEARRPLYRPGPLDRFQPGSVRIGALRAASLGAGQVAVSVDGVPVDPAGVRVTPEGDGRRVRLEEAGAGALIRICLEEPA